MAITVMQRYEMKYLLNGDQTRFLLSNFFNCFKLS